MVEVVVAGAVPVAGQDHHHSGVGQLGGQLNAFHWPH